MDHHFERGGLFDDAAILKMPPSEYFKRQCWISFEPCEVTIPSAAEILGPSKLLWATDYPHFDGFFPGAPRMIADKLPANIRRQVMAQGAVDFYKLN
jgi:predicted TIM-barrel fold metal-dependent hydrolase